LGKSEFVPTSILAHPPHPHAPPHPSPPPLDVLFSQVRAGLEGNPTIWQEFIRWAGHFAVNLSVAALILVVTLWASRWIGRLVRQALGRLPQAQASDTTLQSFVSSLVRWSIVALGMVAVLQQLGVQTTSILAVLGAASLAIGLAVQGALGNVAAGLLILVMKPYRIGDWVEINGKIGEVKRLGLLVTELSDGDNLDIHMPNSKVLGEMIINYSTPTNRRMELNFRVDYDADLDRALEVLITAAKADPRILADPKPWSAVTALGDSAVTVTLRAWATLDVYWDARFDMLKRVKEALQAAGMSWAYPHQVQIEKPVPVPFSRGEKEGPATQGGVGATMFK
jgi:small conductance mechanosensitive channel